MSVVNPWLPCYDEWVVLSFCMIQFFLPARSTARRDFVTRSAGVFRLNSWSWGVGCGMSGV